MTSESVPPSGFATDAATGLLLVGGGSTRMGADKAGLPWGDETLLRRLVACLFGLFGSVRVVGGPREVSGAEAGAPGGSTGRPGSFGWVPDRWPGAGPLGGLISGLAAASTPEVFAVACDMPLLDPEVVRAMRPAAGWRGDARVLRAAGRTHPLHAWYRTACRARLEEAFAGGVRSLHDALGRLEVVEVELAGPLAERAARSCANANTPAEFDRLRRWAQESGSGE